MESNKNILIRNLAESVLRCLENELSGFINSCHERFPHGCCDIASGLLYRALCNEGYEDIFIIRGANKDNLYHVWVEVDELVIDLTSHQFELFDKPMILIRKNEFPLNKIPFYSDTELTDINDWDYFNCLAIEFFEIFYSQYYTRQ